MFRIYINNNQESEKIDEARLEKLVEAVFEAAELEKVGEISVTFVEDDEMAQLNLQYRNLEGPTDVLSFPQDEGMEMARPDDKDYVPLIGDLVISVPTAARQAEEAGHTLEQEISILLIHGILHLFGYDHDNVYQQSFMQEEEKTILKLLEEKIGPKPAEAPCN